jgi:hypothetical protein
LLFLVWSFVEHVVWGMVGKAGYGRAGYDSEGWDRCGLNREGYNVAGFDRAAKLCAGGSNGKKK